MKSDSALEQACNLVGRAIRGEVAKPAVTTFFDEATFTATHVVHDPATKKAAVIDSVMDFEPASGRTSFASAQKVIDHVAAEGLSVEWLLETHAHADHLSAAPYLQEKLGGQIAIGSAIKSVQATFATVFNEDFGHDGSQFDRLFDDGDAFSVGDLPAIALHAPGHTPADLAYVIGDALFTGDTMFMPDYGTARCDFPGGDPRLLYRSIQRLTALPSETRAFLCHDYKAPGRHSFAWETTISEQLRNNLHLRGGVGEDAFVEMRTRRDATLSTPKLLLAAVQVNLRAGRLPDPEENGTSYLKLPLNRI